MAQTHSWENPRRLAPKRLPASCIARSTRTTLRWVLLSSILTLLACSKPETGETKASTAELDRFWSETDDTIHEAQRALRSARLSAREMGGEAAQGDYDAPIALGHRIGGLGHDHVTPDQRPPVISMLTTMITAMDSLSRAAVTDADVAAAKAASDANVSQLSPGAQRLYHLQRAQKMMTQVRDRAQKLGFQSAP